ncbi:MAG: 4Fe-4S dicluster domain-containing protein [Anaerolineaceae bacterium]|jgi:formate hydrogenlyase subunit 6/NADH:ubiquinone oxidoreductase subunit I|nr:4Fe-4S dicluster domain-containing protein [Anaerolineaceae bacterium]
MSRGTPKKTRTEHLMTINRDMLTRNYWMKWNLDKCVGCQIGPIVCPKEALTHVPAVLENGHITQRPSVDVDETKCINCGSCVEACPKHAIELTVNDKPENPVIDYGAFPEFDSKTIFRKEKFDFSLKEFLIENCPTNVISYDEKRDTMRVDFENCIHCRQCEVASKGAFEVRQPWVGSVVLRRELCVPECFACADICPTRALHVNDNGELVLADYYCIKCGACMQVCPVKPEYEEENFTFESHGMVLTRSKQKLVNEETLPIVVERWRINHTPVSSAAWTEALRKLSDDKAKSVEIDRKRALRRADLIEALKGNLTTKAQLKKEIKH